MKLKRFQKNITMASALTVLLTIVNLTYISNKDSYEFQNLANGISGHSNECVFNHYLAVDPTEECHGSREFWACCTHLSYLLEEPSVGVVHEAGIFQGEYFNNLSPDDGRYIPPLSKTREITYFCNELIIETKYVKDGEKLEFVTSDDFVIDKWYKEKELVNIWDFNNDVVDGDTQLFADFLPIEKQISFDVNDASEVDEYGYSSIEKSGYELCISKGKSPVGSFAVLEDRGIIFNKGSIGLVSEIFIDIDDENFESFKVYYGETPLSISNSLDLVSGENKIELDNIDYFTIHNEGNLNVKIKSIKIKYFRKTEFSNIELPKVVVNTKDSKPVTSSIDYVGCNVSTIGADKDVNELKASIKVRGNSTATCPKKPYRIKLDKKNSLFGYKKSKNYCLLADYMDGSKMHNYTALEFAKKVRDKNSFAVNPMHVEVILNGENIGLYLFCEHIDGKEAALDIEQDNVWSKSFEDINFHIERDLSSASDKTEIEGETYFKVNLENYPYSQYVFVLKYPEKDDFEEELDDGTIDSHEKEFFQFFSNLVNYVTDICNRFVDYYHDNSKFKGITDVVDVESLATFGIIDQLIAEADHGLKSFKMYRDESGMLKFGPNWDYDSCAYCLPYEGSYIINPFNNHYDWNRIYIGDTWSDILFRDKVNGRPLFKSFWDEFTNKKIDSFIEKQMEELTLISFSSVYDCERWMHNEFYALFDNVLYYSEFINYRFSYIKDYYSK